MRVDLVAPNPSRGGEERRPDIHCMRMCYVFCIFYRKSVRKSSGQVVFVHGEASRSKYPDSQCSAAYLN